MDYSLINRHNIVDKFFNSLNSLSISTNSTDDIMIFQIDHVLEIKRHVKENTYSFSMYIKGTYEEQDYNENLRYYNPNSNGFMNLKKSVNSFVEVMRYENGHFKMVSAAPNDNWIRFERRMTAIPGGGAAPIEGLVTNLNMSFHKLPLSEDYHFQRTTTDDGFVLDLEYCLKVKDIIDFINSIGSIIVVDESNKLTIPLFFTDRLSKGG